MKNNIEHKDLDQVLKDKKVICLEVATQEELEIVLQAQERDEKESWRINPDLINYDPVSRYVNY